MIRLKKTFSKPRHPWEKQRIIEEKKLIDAYGFKNKKEIWKVKSSLKKIREQAKKLVSVRTEQDEKERNQLINSLANYGIVAKNARIEDVLGLTVNHLCDRRLQTLVHKKGFANTPKQARQLVTHGQVFISNKKIKSPSTLVKVKEEPLIKVKLKLDKSTVKKAKKAKATKEEDGEQ